MPPLRFRAPGSRGRWAGRFRSRRGSATTPNRSPLGRPAAEEVTHDERWWRRRVERGARVPGGVRAHGQVLAHELHPLGARQDDLRQQLRRGHREPRFATRTTGSAVSSAISRSSAAALPGSGIRTTRINTPWRELTMRPSIRPRRSFTAPTVASLRNASSTCVRTSAPLSSSAVTYASAENTSATASSARAPGSPARPPSSGGHPLSALFTPWINCAMVTCPCAF